MFDQRKLTIFAYVWMTCIFSFFAAIQFTLSVLGSTQMTSRSGRRGDGFCDNIFIHAFDLILDFVTCSAKIFNKMSLHQLHANVSFLFIRFLVSIWEVFLQALNCIFYYNKTAKTENENWNFKCNEIKPLLLLRLGLILQLEEHSIFYSTSLANPTYYAYSWGLKIKVLFFCKSHC